MTLLVSIITPEFALHVSDRLVTTRRGRSYRPHDTAANKAILFQASNATVTLGYTGIAHIKGEPTDVWISRILDPGYHHEGTRFGHRGHERDLGWYLIRLREAIDQHYLKATHGAPLTVQVVGQQRVRRLASRPVFYRLDHTGRRGDSTRLFHAETRPMTWKRDKFYVFANGDLTSRPEQDIQQRISALKPGTFHTVEVLEKIAVSAIRRASDLCSTIGSDCMSVQLRSLEGRINIKYLPATPLSDYDVYTPFILFPNVTATPLVMRGGLTDIHWGGLHPITFERANSSPVFDYGGLSRQRRPGWRG